MKNNSKLLLFTSNILLTLISVGIILYGAVNFLPQLSISDLFGTYYLLVTLPIALVGACAYGWLAYRRNDFKFIYMVILLLTIAQVYVQSYNAFFIIFTIGFIISYSILLIFNSKGDHVFNKISSTISLSLGILLFVSYLIDLFSVGLGKLNIVTITFILMSILIIVAGVLSILAITKGNSLLTFISIILLFYVMAVFLFASILSFALGAFMAAIYLVIGYFID
jgi:hypothetical protein